MSFGRRATFRIFRISQLILATRFENWFAISAKMLLHYNVLLRRTLCSPLCDNMLLLIVSNYRSSSSLEIGKHLLRILIRKIYKKIWLLNFFKLMLIAYCTIYRFRQTVGLPVKNMNCHHLCSQTIAETGCRQ